MRAAINNILHSLSPLELCADNVDQVRCDLSCDNGVEYDAPETHALSQHLLKCSVRSHDAKARGRRYHGNKIDALKQLKQLALFVFFCLRNCKCFLSLSKQQPIFLERKTSRKNDPWEKPIRIYIRAMHCCPRDLIENYHNQKIYH